MALEPEEEDPGMRRAKELAELCERRESFAEVSSAGLAKARRKVDLVVERYAGRALEEREKVARVRQSSVSSW